METTIQLTYIQYFSVSKWIAHIMLLYLDDKIF